VKKPCGDADGGAEEPFQSVPGSTPMYFVMAADVALAVPSFIFSWMS
jgi:hypothetical protein